MRHEENSEIKVVSRKIKAALRDIDLNPSQVLEELASIEDSLQNKVLKGRAASSRLGRELSFLNMDRQQAEALSDVQIRGEVLKIVDRLIADVQTLAEKFGVGIGEYVRHVESEASSNPRQR